jgi:4-diphosphocytidyl-2-C-methyl-D-erythritol kinase
VTDAAITLAAHAKINLALRVGARASDGYHQIETLFQRIDLADDVTVRVANGPDTLDVSWDSVRPSDLGSAEQNLAWRAAAAYRDAASWPAHWQINILKRIPAGAGLGGGSADAAAVLCALDQLAPLPLGVDRLLALGAKLGADVPFPTTRESRAIGRGRGEKLQRLPPLAPAHVLLLVPPFGTSTAHAYSALDAQRERRGTPGSSGAAELRAPALVSWGAVALHQFNDFEASVFAEHAELGAARATLEEHGALIARLSGSGSTVFGLWDSHLPASPIRPGTGWHSIATRTV